MSSLQLGLGLLSVGRTWGIRDVAPPTAAEARHLIEVAYKSGLRFFDTAPAYAASEQILGEALCGPVIDRSQVTIATKMGEFWDQKTGGSSVSHNFDNLARSIDSSLEKIGQIDILQLHKSTPETIDAPDVIRAFNYARSLGITRFGASVSDMQTAQIACRTGRYQYLQFPFNQLNTNMKNMFEILREAKMGAIINRPLAMGGLASGGKEEGIQQAYQFIASQSCSGIILTGTGSTTHLAENINAFSRIEA